MKKIFIVLFSVFLNNYTIAQLAAINAKSIKDFETIEKNTTIAILTGYESYDKALINAMNKYWKIGKFDTMYSSNISKTECKEGKNYLLSLTMQSAPPGNVSRMELDRTKPMNGPMGPSYKRVESPSMLDPKTYHNYGLIIGQDKKVKGYSYEDMVSYSPIDYFGLEKNPLNIFSRLPLVIYNIQNTLELVKKNNINGNTLQIVKQLKSIYNQNAGILKNKTLLIYKDRTKDVDGPKEKKKSFIRSYSSIGEALAEGDKLVPEEEFAKLYKYPFEYASMEKILQAIQDHDPRYAYLCPQITVNKSIFVYDLETFVPLYYDYAIQGVKINTSDVKNLYSTVKESNSKTIKYQYINLDKNSITRTSENSMDQNNKSTADQATSPSLITSGPASSPGATESRPENTSAIAHGEARIPNASAAKNYKYKADEKSAEYYTELRKKFEEEDKIKKQKDSVLAIENAKKEEEIKQGRRLPEEQAPQFDKYRQGAKNPVVEKTTAEEDYKTIFK